MKVQNIVRKAVAIGSAAGFVGATLMGAMAYDLSTYPAKFIVDGKTDGKIVVGEKAATPDVLGAIDIAATLQAASVSKVPVPGAVGKTTLEGDAFEISTTSDQLELREAVGEVVDTITADDLAGLKSGKITTSEGTTDYSQYLRLQDGSSLQDMAVNFITNDGEDVEKMSDYFVVDTSLPFLEWEIQFNEGLESEWDSVTKDLDDMEDRTFNIMGTDFTVVTADVNAGNTGFSMELMGGSVPDTLREGETKTYTINGVDYEVTLVFVSDPSSSTSEPEVKFSVNGEITQAMEAGDTDTLSGGLQIGVRDILVNAREGVASFYLGAHKITFTDSNTNDTVFTTGSIDINDEVSESNVLQVSGAFVDADTWEITSMKYQVTMESEDGSGGVAYVPKGEGLRALMDEPELLISDTLDIKYEGLAAVDTKQVKVNPISDDEYRITFTNLDGDTYSFPFLSTDGVLKFGDSDDDLVFVEAGAATHNVGPDDFIIVSSKAGADGDKAVTNVLQYTDYDNDQRTVEFKDLAGGTVSTVVDTTGLGTIKVGGHSYTINVSNTSALDPLLAVDFDGDGSITAGEYANVTTWGGVVIELANNITNTSTATVLPTLANLNGNGKIIGTNATIVTSGAAVYSRLFDTAGTETFSWKVTESLDATELDLDFLDTTYGGPLDGVVEWNDFTFEQETDGSDTNAGMTDYGILVKEDDPDGDDPNTLTMDVPESQRVAQVFVTLGSVSAVEGGAGSADKVNPIALGLGILDKDAESLVGKENLIVVGGPCANTVAFSLLDSPAECADGFESGKAVIQAWDKGDKVAILVAGYSAQDTQGASRVLASYKDYADKLKGSEVEVVVADLNSITVKPAQ